MHTAAASASREEVPANRMSPPSDALLPLEEEDSEGGGAAPPAAVLGESEMRIRWVARARPATEERPPPAEW